MAMKKQWFTPEGEKEMRRMLWGAWEYIGNDIMTAVQESGGSDIPAADVIEVVLDADHLSSQARTPEQNKLLAMFNQMPYKDKIKFAKTVFTAKRYC